MHNKISCIVEGIIISFLFFFLRHMCVGDTCDMCVCIVGSWGLKLMKMEQCLIFLKITPLLHKHLSWSLILETFAPGVKICTSFMIGATRDKTCQVSTYNLLFITKQGFILPHKQLYMKSIYLRQDVNKKLRHNTYITENGRHIFTHTWAYKLMWEPKIKCLSVSERHGLQAPCTRISHLFPHMSL